MSNNLKEQLADVQVPATSTTVEASHALTTLTMEQAIDLFPGLFTVSQRGALAAKYNSKYGKYPAERSSHVNSFPAYADNAAMLYILSGALKEANDKIAADRRSLYITNVVDEVNSYVFADTLSEYQVNKNKETDSKIVNLRDSIGDNHSEHITILKGVRDTWLSSFGTGYRDMMDKKLRRACHIFKVTPEELESAKLIRR